MTRDEALKQIADLANSGEGPGFALLVLKKDGSADVRTDVTFEEYAAIGRVEDCTCGLIQCVCLEARKHEESCRYRKALTCPVAFECDPHGFDVCPECDPCTCGKDEPAMDAQDPKT